MDLTFELDPTETNESEARLIFHRREGVSADAPLVLDGDELKMTGLLLDQDGEFRPDITMRRNTR